jgi:hypothetical protein
MSKGSISKKKNPTPEKGVRKMRKKKKKKKKKNCGITLQGLFSLLISLVYSSCRRGRGTRFKKELQRQRLLIVNSLVM